ncbi:related to RKM1 - SET-domain lysine-N-methyltransferase [Melanopsichium pennsylvanicum]|uniref:Related to RKM1 - SET-domain lysine-N-methyltransferase n=2 Tax=Melanopsichium pennsylvanicum TaxID=63383 RepID=A0AAJ4XH49_9BASI|nr:conserved hypothetical protein [Melanopsichium pennsylvanicum 4]SNX82370.1 related to RKM1 - SET-domain lysine-N-methyltransferase [Melanopsichium pennsylvanicum]
MNSSHTLLEWFTSVGVKLNSSLYLKQDPQTGLSFYTAQPLPKDTTVIQVPKQLCITSSSARQCIQLIFEKLGGSELHFEEVSLPAPDWILLYLVLTRLADQFLSIASAGNGEEVKKMFMHLDYVSHIPKHIVTPLHFSAAELTLLTNTPLVGSTERRLLETIVDYERARSLIATLLFHSCPFLTYLATALQPVSSAELENDKFMAQTYHKGLELWRWAESAFTSRSFPPRLIGLSDHRDALSSDTAAASAPILIPAYDTFNHARAHPVTWSHSPACATHCDMVSMTLNYQVPTAPCQVYNNYGGKSNEEFLAGYGFTLDTVSEDTLALRLGSEGDGAGQQANTHYWHIPSESTIRSQTTPHETMGDFVKTFCPCPPLLAELERIVLQGDEPPWIPEEQLELYASVLETLESLLLSKRKAFRASQKQIESLHDSLDFHVIAKPEREEGWYRSKGAADVNNASSFRLNVWSNVMQYRAGQLHVMNHAVDWTRTELGRVADALDGLDQG